MDFSTLTTAKDLREQGYHNAMVEVKDQDGLPVDSPTLMVSPDGDFVWLRGSDVRAPTIDELNAYLDLIIDHGVTLETFKNIFYYTNITVIEPGQTTTAELRGDYSRIFVAVDDDSNVMGYDWQ